MTVSMAHGRWRFLPIRSLLATLMVSLATTSWAQEVAAPVKPAEGTAEEETRRIDTIEVTGSRIMREEYYANSPVSTVTRDQILSAGDVTLEQYLQTLPQVNPTFTTTSNNPGTGQANIDLRALGANRNLILIDGRRPMPSSSGMTVDLNAIPVALIERIEILSGGAGATYGADAVAGAINIITKKKFEGVDLRSTWRDSTPEKDSQERMLSIAIGQSFMSGRGSFSFGADYGDRERMIKRQRDFATFATSTTGSLPEGLWSVGGTTNPASQAAIDSLFLSYNTADCGTPGFPACEYAAGGVVNSAALIGFNTDGTLFSRGVFNNPLDVVNYRYPIDASVNQNFFPDLYSYNFDEINILQLPLERYSAMAKLDFELTDSARLFSQASWASYENAQALAPTPAGGVTRCNVDANADGVPDRASRSNAVSPLVECSINPANGQPRQTSGLLVPVTNPFIPADLMTLLNSRTGNNANIVGTGATEAFLLGYRFLPAGLREQVYTNTVKQLTAGIDGDLSSGWRYSAYWSSGETLIKTNILGNINVQAFQDLLSMSLADQEAAGCAGGFNPFGRNPISASCLDLLKVPTAGQTLFKQEIYSAYVAGDLGQLPAGAISAVLGAERRDFEYGNGRSLPSDETYFIGFNTSADAAGRNQFKDIYGELLIPVLRDKPFAQILEVGLGYRLSSSSFEDVLTGENGGSSGDSAYKLDISYKPLDLLRTRLSYQHAVRAPNFGELFDGGGGFPQFFDPCGVSSWARSAGNPDKAALEALCVATGVSAAAMPNFVPAPGGQTLTATEGNTRLDPEVGRTLTLGFVLESPWDGLAKDLTASIDYYRIKIDSPILAPDPNVIIAECYNYFGTNPTYDATTPNCASIAGSRSANELANAQLFNSQSASGAFPGENGGLIDTSGIDIQVDYGVNMADLGAPEFLGRLRLNLLVNYLLNFEQQDATYLPIVDYTGTASYFGQGNTGAGGSLPKMRMVLNSSLITGPFTFDMRTRYIDGMTNRAEAQFRNESFSSPGSVFYWDMAAAYQATSNLQVRLGMNNLFDRQPPGYAPNVQSGTDPSLYDVVGRSAVAQVKVTF